MLSINLEDKRVQVEMYSIDQLVPEDHLVRKIEAAIDFDFIYDMVKDKYSLDKGRPSLDPVVLIKLVLIQYIFGIKSMRQTIKEIETNLAYRWFLHYGLSDKIPHFITFGKNYTRRFKDSGIFEKIFTTVLEKVIKSGFVKPDTVFIVATHVKANANKKKFDKVLIEKESRSYQGLLEKEINEDRLQRNKKPLDNSKKNEVKGS